MSLRFALIGAAGYVAPRHMKAIKDIGGELVAALDPHDSVGILDAYFPECRFFTEFERFDRHCEKLKREGRGVDFVSIASPNYLHDSHCRFALRIGADAICEKPLCLNEHNIDGLVEIEKATGNRIWNVLQLRNHPNTAWTKNTFKLDGSRHRIKISYSTPRGQWYHASWKADSSKSGGIATNIGVHLFDWVTHIFGNCNYFNVTEKTDIIVSGELNLQHADVQWRLSIDQHEKPTRTFEINGEPLSFNGGFTDLHTEVYRQILDGKGYGVEQTRQAIRITQKIRQWHTCASNHYDLSMCA